jgi:hypothetical protein
MHGHYQLNSQSRYELHNPKSLESQTDESRISRDLHIYMVLPAEDVDKVQYYFRNAAISDLIEPSIILKACDRCFKSDVRTRV